MTEKDIWVVVFILGLSALVGQAGPLVLQPFVVDGNATFPFETQVLVPNTTEILPKLIMIPNSGNYRIPVPAPLGQKALSMGLADTFEARDVNGVWGNSVKSQANLVRCNANELECITDVAIYADYDMECTRQRNTSSKVTEFGHYQIKKIVSTASSFDMWELNFTAVYHSIPIITWTIVELHQGENEMTIACTIYAASTTRRESSISGTINKTTRDRYDKFNRPDFQTCSLKEDSPCHQANIVQKPPPPIPFYPSDGCAFLASPICALKLLQNQLFRNMNGTFMSGAAQEFTYMSNILNNLNSAGKNESLLDVYEQEMRFAVERMYKRVLVSQFTNANYTMNQTCVNCTVRKTRWIKNKGGFMIYVVVMNGSCAVMVLVSLALTLRYRQVPDEGLNAIDILRLKFDANKLDEEDAEVTLRVSEAHVANKKESINVLLLPNHNQSL
ncbi:hypothetical protein BDR26DRAFT_283472 [Obelidium mucronatum]|nr:hypothetical protein BDR26DRAFT_283472 [Obelidium mucronatum]